MTCRRNAIAADMTLGLFYAKTTIIVLYVLYMFGLIGALCRRTAARPYGRPAINRPR